MSNSPPSTAIWVNQSELYYSIDGQQAKIRSDDLVGIRVRLVAPERYLVAIETTGDAGSVIATTDIASAGALCRFVHLARPDSDSDAEFGTAPTYGSFELDITAISEAQAALSTTTGSVPAEQLLTSTLLTITGYDIIEEYGVVTGSTVRARNIGAKLVAGVTQNLGGELAGYTRLLQDARAQSLQRMCIEARARGANAVVGIGFTTGEFFEIAVELLAYGTAVKVSERNQDQSGP